MDWLAFTFTEDSKNAGLWLHKYASYAENDAIAPRNGYECATKAQNGVVHMWHTTRTEMGHHVVIAGTALRNLCEQLGLHQKEVLGEVIHAGGRITRLDLAKDLQGVPVALDQIYNQLVSKQNEGTARTFARMTSAGGGDTLYVGSRQSEKFIRIYDKAAESKLSGELWFRFEIESKGMVGRALAEVLINTNNWAGAFDDMARHMVKLPDSEQYALFFTEDSVPIGLPKLERNSDRERWIETQVMPAVVKHFTDNPKSEAIALLRKMLDLIDKQLND